MFDKIFMWGLLVLMAIPVPLSLMSWIGTLISLGAFAQVNWHNPKCVLEAIIFGLCMLLAGTYVITYLLSLIYTLITQQISFVTVLPIMHLISGIILYHFGK